MVTSSLTILAVIVYFVFCLAVIFSKISGNGLAGFGGSFSSSLVDSYSIVFGDRPDKFEESNRLYIIMVIIDSIFLPIFFINFLIAQLSNSYESLEQRQYAIAIREIADSL